MKLAKVAAAGSVAALCALTLGACGSKSSDSASKQVLNWNESAASWSRTTSGLYNRSKCVR